MRRRASFAAPILALALVPRTVIAERPADVTSDTRTRVHGVVPLATEYPEEKYESCEDKISPVLLREISAWLEKNFVRSNGWKESARLVRLGITVDAKYTWSITTDESGVATVTIFTDTVFEPVLQHRFEQFGYKITNCELPESCARSSTGTKAEKRFADISLEGLCATEGNAGCMFEPVYFQTGIAAKNETGLDLVACPEWRAWMMNKAKQKRSALCGDSSCESAVSQAPQNPRPPVLQAMPPISR